MEVGKKYIRCDEFGNEILFPFREKIGKYLGVAPNGFLRFKLSEKRECIMNGGMYKEMQKNKKGG